MNREDFALVDTPLREQLAAVHESLALIEDMIRRRILILVAPQGFEPRLIGSEPTVLPLNEGATQVKTGSCRLGGSHNQPPL